MLLEKKEQGSLETALCFSPQSFRKCLDCIISLSHHRQGKKRGGHSHILLELEHILDHVAWLQVQTFFHLCSRMLAAKVISCPLYNKGKRPQNAPCYSLTLLVLPLQCIPEPPCLFMTTQTLISGGNTLLTYIFLNKWSDR